MLISEIKVGVGKNVPIIFYLHERKYPFDTTVKHR